MRPENNRILNLRANVFGAQNMNDEMLYRREHEIAAMRRTLSERGIRFCVAPGASLQSVTGRVLAPGDEVVLGDFRNEGDVPAWRALERAVESGRVLERY